MHFLTAICILILFIFHAEGREHLLPKKGREVQLRWKGIENNGDYRIEFSKDKNFSPEKTSIFETFENYFWIKIAKEGRYYWRVQEEYQEDDEYVVKLGTLDFKKPNKLPAPKIEWLGRWTDQLEYPKNLKWKRIWPAKEYIIEAFDASSKESIFEAKTENVEYTFEEFFKQSPGYYIVRIAAIDKFGWVGNFSQCQWTYVGKKIQLPRPPTSNQRSAICSQRLPASVFEISSGFDNVGIIYNKDFSKSHFQIEGASFAMKSIAQTDTGQDFALAMIYTLRSQYWLNHRHGLEASLKATAVGYNDLGNNINPTSGEVRYHMRFHSRFPWLSWIPESKFTLFTGYEVYKNETANGATFIKNYELFKAGISAKFRLFERWDVGGEIAYGQSIDSTRKFELQGYLNYYLKRRWSLGLGYRLHLISLENASISPTGEAPFREAFGESFGNLRYSF